MTKLRAVLDNLNQSLWVVPCAMSLGAIVLSYVTLSLDHSANRDALRELELFWLGSADGARSILSTIAAAMVTVVGLVFSLTIVVFQLASRQFGPRLLRNFLRDRGTQLVLGTFIATHIYALLVLRTVRGDDGGEFVPHISVTLGLLLGIASLGLLIYFIHHVAVSIQPAQVLRKVSGEIRENIESLFPERLGEGAPAEAAPEALRIDPDMRPVRANCEGFLQSIDGSALMRELEERGARMTLLFRPGDFIIEGAPVAFVSEELSEEEAFRLTEDVLTIASRATPLQDIRFSLNQLVELALRALSPAMNDPFTALQCVDRLESALGALFQRRFPSPVRTDSAGVPRVTLPASTKAELLPMVLAPLRESARRSGVVLIGIAEMISNLAPLARDAGLASELFTEAELVREAARELSERDQRREIVRLVGTACDVLAERAAAHA